MLRTALAHDDGPIAFRYPRGTAEGVPLPEPRARDPDRHRRGPPGGRARRAARLRLRRPGRQRRRRACSPSTGSTPTVADARFAKPLDAELVERLAAEHDLVVTIEENVLPGGFGSAVLEHVEDAFADRGRRARDPARRPTRPLRHPRQAGAAARGGRPHRRGRRRARDLGAAGGLRSPGLARLAGRLERGRRRRRDSW